MVKKVIEDKRYKFKLHVIVGVTCEQAKAEAKKLGFEFEDSLFGGFDGNMYEGIMWMHKKPDFYTLCHECAHVAFHIMHNKGIPVSYENDEGMAYMIEFWFKSVREALK
jgi:hypothetical protein